MNKNHIEIFTAGCSICEPVVQFVKETAGANCNISIYNLSERSYNNICKKYSIKRLPSIVVNGILLDCCKNIDITKEDLINAGIGN